MWFNLNVLGGIILCNNKIIEHWTSWSDLSFFFVFSAMHDLREGNLNKFCAYYLCGKLLINAFWQSATVNFFPGHKLSMYFLFLILNKANIAHNWCFQIMLLGICII